MYIIIFLWYIQWNLSKPDSHQKK